jgi:hypothetical protein
MPKNMQAAINRISGKIPVKPPVTKNRIVIIFISFYFSLPSSNPVSLSPSGATFQVTQSP